MNNEFSHEEGASRYRGDRIATGVAVAFVVVFAGGLAWWASDRAAIHDADGLFGDQPTVDAATQGDRVLPGPAPAAPAEINNGQAVGTTTTGVVTLLDLGQRTLTLDNGQTYALGANMPTDNIQQGVRVTVTYTAEADRNVITRLQPATNNVAPALPDGPPAAPVVP